MNRRFAASAVSVVLAFCLTGVSSAAVAGPRSAATTTATAPIAKVKLISFHLRNETKAPLLLQMGDQQITVDPGATTSLKLASGQQIVVVNATPRVAAGTVIGTVGNELQGNTLVVN